MRIKELTAASIGKEVTIEGWVRTVREQKNFSFIECNDGSTLANLQIIYEGDATCFTTGCSIIATGVLVKSPAKNQEVELSASKIELIGSCDPAVYPLQKKRHSFEFLRQIAHLRPRTNGQGAVARVRNALSFATHKFFQERNFLYVQTPIITASDCEGAGQLFRVTTLEPGEKDLTKDFFHKPAYLTVSGQLNGEIYACALRDIYTFGPTFRAENSHTARHLAEFWMIEPEMAFADLNDNRACAEDYIKYVLCYLFQTCPKELEFFDAFVEQGLIKRLEGVIDKPFAHLTYTEAIELLLKANKSFEYPVKWGLDLQSEHERFLAEEVFKKPLILTDYPKGIKAFYMRGNEDGETVAAMDVLVPKIGELVGGSQREERFEVLEKRLEESGLSKEAYWWYLELRKFGSVPHAGFGVGFERLVLFATGMENIRDVIPFPRFPASAEF